MTTETDALSHYGVLGMKWGVRKSRPTAEQRQKAQAKWEKKASRSFFKDYNRAARQMNRVELKKINNKPEYKGKKLDRSGRDDALAKKYDIEVGNKLTSLMTQSANRRLGASPIGRRRMKYEYDYASGDIHFSWTNPPGVAKQDGIDDYFFIGKTDSNGFIISVEVGGALEQSFDDVEEFFEHYGVKGMRWGVRTADRPEASGDATTFRGIKAKAKAGGVKSLSNKELQDFIQRANLEQQYHRLNPSAKKKALQFTADILLGVGKQQAMKLAGDVATKQLANLLKK